MLGRPLRSVVPVIDDFVSVRDTGEPVLNKVARLRDDLVVEKAIVRTDYPTRKSVKSAIAALLPGSHPQHPKQDERIIKAFKKTSPTRLQRT